MRRRFPAKWFEIKKWLGGMEDSYLEWGGGGGGRKRRGGSGSMRGAARRQGWWEVAGSG